MLLPDESVSLRGLYPVPSVIVFLGVNRVAAGVNMDPNFDIVLLPIDVAIMVGDLIDEMSPETFFGSPP